MYIVRQKITGYIEYVVDSDSPVNDVVNLTNNAVAMNSTQTLDYTNDITIVRKVKDTDLNDPTIKRAVIKLRDSRTPELPELGKRRKTKASLPNKGPSVG
jgi:hypothetical protein